MDRTYIYSKEHDVGAIVAKGDDAKFRKLGFSVVDSICRKSGNYTSVFKGTQEKYFQCIIDKKDIEFFVRLGFVANANRLPSKGGTNVNSPINSKRQSSPSKSTV